MTVITQTEPTTVKYNLVIKRKIELSLISSFTLNNKIIHNRPMGSLVFL